MNSNIIFRQNPWWSDVEKIDQEPRLLVLKNLPIVWQPSFINDINLNEDAVHILTGPRQVGKSTATRILIREMFFKNGIKPKQLLLFNCDILAEPKDIVDVVLYFQDNVAEKGRKYIILDEITAVPNWPNAVKWLVDNGYGRECIFILTGSTSIQIKKSGEFLPGRRGKGRDILLLPLSFGEYIKLIYPDIKPINLKNADFKELQKFHSDIVLNYQDINLLFDGYWRHGGFLRPINEIKRDGVISPETVEVYLSWIKGEIAKDGKREQIARGVIEKLLTSLSSGLSYQGVAEYVDVGSHNTARAYLDFFIDSFIVEEVPFAEISQKRVAWRKNRKYYLSDPFLVWIAYLWSGGGDSLASVANQVAGQPAEAGRLAENIVQNHLRKYGHTPYYGEVRGQEVDFYLKKEDIGIEVKYQNRITPLDTAAVKTFEKGFCVTPDTLADMGHAIAIPAFLFCMCDI